MNDIELQPVDSSAIAAIGYDAPSKILHIQFHSRQEPYRYGPIEAHEHEAFRTADSVGQHFHKHVRGKEILK